MTIKRAVIINGDQRGGRGFSTFFDGLKTLILWIAEVDADAVVAQVTEKTRRVENRLFGTATSPADHTCVQHERLPAVFVQDDWALLKQHGLLVDEVVRALRAID